MCLFVAQFSVRRGWVDWVSQTPTPDTFPAWLIICVAYKCLANSEIATPATTKTRVLLCPGDSVQGFASGSPPLSECTGSGSSSLRWLMVSAATRRTATAPAFVATAFANGVRHASLTVMAGRRDRNATTAPWRRAHCNNQTSGTVRVPQVASSRPRRVRPDQPRRTPSLRWTDQPTPHGLICEGAQRPVRTGIANDTLIAMPTLMRLGHLITVVTVARGTTRCSTSPGLRIRTGGCGARR
jgi:hypothetical protein